MKHLIAMLGAIALTVVVACDEGKGSEAGKAGDKAAMANAGDTVKAGGDKAAADKAAAAKAAAAKAAPPVDEAETYAATILDSDFDAEALREINDGNAQAELDALAKAIEEK